jgi:hypothetical protein
VLISSTVPQHISIFLKDLSSRVRSSVTSKQTSVTVPFNEITQSNFLHFASRVDVGFSLLGEEDERREKMNQ